MTGKYYKLQCFFSAITTCNGCTPKLWIGRVVRSMVRLY